MPLNHILRKCTTGYKLSRSPVKINHVMYMDDIKVFAKNEKELKTLIHAIRIYSQEIGMEFGIEKCAIIVMKRGKRHITDGMDVPNQDKSSRRKRNLQILGHFEGWHHQTNGKERQNSKRISQEN